MKVLYMIQGITLLAVGINGALGVSEWLGRIAGIYERKDMVGIVVVIGALVVSALIMSSKQNRSAAVIDYKRQNGIALSLKEKGMIARGEVILNNGCDSIPGYMDQDGGE